MQNQDYMYSPEARGFSHSDPYDTRTYHPGQGRGYRNTMPDGRGSYEPGDLETRWDAYNAAHYGRTPNTSRREHLETYRSSANGPYNHYELDDYRYSSGNREWHLNQSNRESRNDYHRDRYRQGNRYGDMHQRNQNRTGSRDVFEWVGSGIGRAWDGVTHRHRTPDRDHDYHQSYQNESMDYGVNEENMRRYGNRTIQGYEKGHNFGDDTPQQQQNNRERGYGNPDSYPPRY